MSLKEAAAHFGVNWKTIKRWIESGRIKAIQPAGPGGRLFIPKA
jgi:excisionase family DNA binding protein